MMEFNAAIAVMDDADLLACPRELARKSCLVESELLLHLGEIEARNLHTERAYPSMFAFCMKELGFSEGAPTTAFSSRVRLGDCRRSSERWAPAGFTWLGSAFWCRISPRRTATRSSRRPRVNRSARSRSWSPVWRRSRPFPT